jgi:hypothetical protein
VEQGARSTEQGTSLRGTGVLRIGVELFGGASIGPAKAKCLCLPRPKQRETLFHDLAEGQTWRLPAREDGALQVRGQKDQPNEAAAVG